MKINNEWGKTFAQEWIESWNAHDLDRILSHYSDDIEMKSPLIIERLKKSGGYLKGKDEVKAYWQIGVNSTPPLKFELIDILLGVDTLTIYYRSVGRRVVAETLEFNNEGKISRGIVHWSLQ